jgi:microsomal dipeptidase-like Zn-dependent dipeptidase
VTRSRKAAGALLAAAAVLLLVVFSLGPRIVAGRMNPTLPSPSASAAPSVEAVRIHGSLRVADLHGDALLWDQDLTRRRETGHVDLVRLAEGHVAVQVFSTVTKVPRGINLVRNSGDSDLITALAVLQLWPPRSWTSPLVRALHQARKLQRLAEASDGRLVVVRDRRELDAFLRRTEAGDGSTAGVLSTEGAHVLEGDIENLERLYRAGFRMLGLAHFFDNEVGGSAHGLRRGGLTELGRAVVDRMEELGVAVDLAHASPELFDDVLALATKPVVVSHTGVKALCDNPRTLDDARMTAVAASGGVIGIGLWPDVLCGHSPAAWARAVRYAVDLVGVDHVALGSDWDGAVPVIVDAAGTVHLVDALLSEGFGAQDISKIMGGNTLRVFREMLPPGTANGDR